MVSVYTQSTLQPGWSGALASGQKTTHSSRLAHFAADCTGELVLVLQRHAVLLLSTGERIKEQLQHVKAFTIFISVEYL